MTLGISYLQFCYKLNQNLFLKERKRNTNETFRHAFYPVSFYPFNFFPVVTIIPFNISYAIMRKNRPLFKTKFIHYLSTYIGISHEYARSASFRIELFTTMALHNCISLLRIKWRNNTNSRQISQLWKFIKIGPNFKKEQNLYVTILFSRNPRIDLIVSP